METIEAVVNIWTNRPLHTIWWIGVFGYLGYSIWTAAPGSALDRPFVAACITCCVVVCFGLFLSTRRLHAQHLREQEEWKKRAAERDVSP